MWTYISILDVDIDVGTSTANHIDTNTEFGHRYDYRMWTNIAILDVDIDVDTSTADHIDTNTEFGHRYEYRMWTYIAILDVDIDVYIHIYVFRSNVHINMEK